MRSLLPRGTVVNSIELQMTFLLSCIAAAVAFVWMSAESILLC